MGQNENDMMPLQETSFDYELSLMQLRLSERRTTNINARSSCRLPKSKVKKKETALKAAVLKSVVSLMSTSYKKFSRKPPERNSRVKSIVSKVAKDPYKEISHIERREDKRRTNEYSNKRPALMSLRVVPKCLAIVNLNKEIVVIKKKEKRSKRFKDQLINSEHQGKEIEECEKQFHPAYIGKDDMEIDCVILPFTGPEGLDCFEFQTVAELNSIQKIHNITQFAQSDLDRILGLILCLWRILKE